MLKIIIPSLLIFAAGSNATTLLVSSTSKPEYCDSIPGAINKVMQAKTPGTGVPHSWASRQLSPLVQGLSQCMLVVQLFLSTDLADHCFQRCDNYRRCKDQQANSHCRHRSDYRVEVNIELPILTLLWLTELSVFLPLSPHLLIFRLHIAP